MSRRDSATMLERALLASAADAECPITISAIACTNWSSAAFVGGRHRLTVEAGASPAADAWLANLAEIELPVRGHLIVDLSIRSTRREGERLLMEIEVLTVEEHRPAAGEPGG
jgi:hypothetical protein